MTGTQGSSYMGQKQDRAILIQEALSNLSLQPKSTTGETTTDRVLVGKIITTRLFRRFTLSEIVQKTWRLKARVQINKLSDNVFKFIFGNRAYKEFVFKSRPRSINGAILVLKKWSEDRVFSDISFELTMFFVQIHGLPLSSSMKERWKALGNK